MENNDVSEDLSDLTHRQPDSDNNDQRLYFVPYRWWKDAQDSTISSESDGKRGVLYMGTSGSSYAGPMKLINNIFNSDLVLNLRREEESLQNGENGEVGVSGRDYALVSGEMWLKALKWHSDAKVASKSSKTFSAAEDDMSDVYPLQLRLSVLREVNSLGVKISKKENATELFRRACKIFSVDSEMLRIWDFSGQTTLFFVNDKSKSPKESQRQLDQEIVLELQVYGLSDNMKCRDGKKDDAVAQNCNGTHSSGTSLMNGSVSNTSTSFFRCDSSALFGKSGEAGSLGLTGLQNLGNTCFMNSAIQCLAHTPKLVDYFLGDYGREINHDNPLGMDGEIALAFGDLLRKLWAPGATPVAPRTFKSKLARFAPQFSGFNQHDSQELLAFLLDGLHEDLNRVKSKPYVEAKDGEGRLDEEVADEYWQNHVARNDSIIVDICQGQYKSTLVCPICKKVSVTFDPFMYLSLPLPSTNIRTMTLTVVSTDGSSQPSSFTISVPKYGKCEDLTQALSKACSLGIDEMLLVAEVYNNRIIRYLEEPSDSLSLIRDGDRLVAYRLKKELDNIPLVVFMHQHMEEQYVHGKQTSSWKAFGIPLVGPVHSLVNGSDIHNLYLKLLSPFHIPADDGMYSCNNTTSTAKEEITEKDNGCSASHGNANPSIVEEATNSSSYSELQFYITDEKGIVQDLKIGINEPVPVTGVPKRFNVLVCWTEKQIEQYDTRLLSSLPEVFKSGFLAKRPQESVSLYKCLEAFLKEEPLGPDDMWFCPSCKKHRQASKKLDLWRLPEILVIHLKRFSYTRFMKNKLEAYVDFPVDDLDLSAYISYKNGQLSHRYMLYAISNHYGSMGGGHYTAFVHHGAGRWYDFDDSLVHPISQDKIKTSAAYVLFYRRVVEV
ncbi:Ubiquitin carboxyl-terminal hydrolase, putative [Ricinus communis]|uniref:Ubiquitin carboxyl-terminal hydrolase n=1 Tax=Ricinus communis TaxID=3988 RepID=B9RQ57_RICCO|nr:Ubiquitin carboxyl-terminal hydrolase, putative [Ricinus communis]|eukprot:XP_002515876.1 ubiquitin carboxyl-terminal hydrolase 8 [Ricinus communis]